MSRREIATKGTRWAGEGQNRKCDEGADIVQDEGRNGNLLVEGRRMIRPPVSMEEEGRRGRNENDGPLKRKGD